MCMCFRRIQINPFGFHDIIVIIMLDRVVSGQILHQSIVRTGIRNGISPGFIFQFFKNSLQ